MQHLHSNARGLLEYQLAKSFFFLLQKGKKYDLNISSFQNLMEL